MQSRTLGPYLPSTDPAGTPLQNNLAELWSLLNYLLPDIFSNLADFEDWFDFSGLVGTEGATEAVLAAEQRNRVVSKLHSILKPFVLRRIKADVEASLPAKLELVLYANMADTQKKINEELLNKTLNVRALLKTPRPGKAVPLPALVCLSAACSAAWGMRVGPVSLVLPF
jgi:SNF2-related domain